jgi:uncharacterized protein (TIGR02265 family)
MSTRMRAANVADQPRMPSSVPPSGDRPVVDRGAVGGAHVDEEQLAGLNGTYFEAMPAWPLAGDIDVDVVAAAIPETHSMRGLFFVPLMEQLRLDYPQIVPRLSCPPRFGRYLPFEDYPLRDFLHLFDVVARRTHPSSSGREAYRLQARSAVGVFAQSMLGRVTMNLMTNPMRMLLRYPESFGAFAKGPRARASQSGQRSAEIHLTGYCGVMEYPLGVLEALVLSFGVTPVTLVDTRTPNEVRFSLRW